MMRSDKQMEREDRIFDALLKAASDEILAEELEDLPTDEELDEIFPNFDSLDKKVHAIINKEFRALRFKKVMRIVSRSAAILCIGIVLSTSILMAYPASRNFILSYLMNFYDDHVRFEFGIEPIQSGEPTAVTFPYAPEGFDLVSSSNHNTIITYKFENADGQIIIMQHFFGRSLTMGIDTEYAHFTQIQLGGRVVYKFEATEDYDLNAIMWLHDDDVKMITSSLGIEMLIHLAKMYMAH